MSEYESGRPWREAAANVVGGDEDRVDQTTDKIAAAIPDPPGWTDRYENAYVHALSRRRSLKGRLQRWLLLLHAEHAAGGNLPTSVRFLFYELEQRGVVSKVRTNRDGKTSIRRADTDVSDALTVLRDAGLVDWSHIVDETRDVDTWDYAPTIREYLTDVSLPLARVDAWDGHPPPLIVCESRSLAGVLRRYASRYLCPITSTNGQSGGSLLHNDVLPLLAEEKRAVLYFGDLDLAGGHIETSTRDRLAGWGAYVDEWERIAITAEQVNEHGFAPIVKVDKRYRGGREYEAWETEALGQATVERLLTDRLDLLRENLGLDPIDDVLERDEEERQRWLNLLNDLDAES